MSLVSKILLIPMLGFSYFCAFASVVMLISKWPPDTWVYYVAVGMTVILLIGLALTTISIRILWRTPDLRIAIVPTFFVMIGLFGLASAIALYPRTSCLLPASIAFVGVAYVLRELKYLILGYS